APRISDEPDEQLERDDQVRAMPRRRIQGADHAAGFPRDRRWKVSRQEAFGIDGTSQFPRSAQPEGRQHRRYRSAWRRAMVEKRDRDKRNGARKKAEQGKIANEFRYDEGSRPQARPRAGARSSGFGAAARFSRKSGRRRRNDGSL